MHNNATTTHHNTGVWPSPIPGPIMDPENIRPPMGMMNLLWKWQGGVCCIGGHDGPT